MYLMTSGEMERMTYSEKAEVVLQRAFDAYAEGLEILERPLGDHPYEAHLDRTFNRMNWAAQIKNARQLASIAFEKDSTIF